ncbi:MAG: flippase-like domain-containing protein [Candidatus Omnitrophota bacterium]|nr:MAG: flippase-like domain-containing protein [Candidatus Omnitrophota bacterium]
MRLKLNRKVFFIFRILVSFALLFALFKFVPYRQLKEIYRDSHKIYILLGFVIFFFLHIIGVGRWRCILLSLGIKVRWREALYAFFSGLFFNLFFLSFVAGDTFRGFGLSHRYGNLKGIASSVLMDRLSGAVALNCVALISFLIGRHLLPQREVLFALILLSLIIGGAALIIFSKTFFSCMLVIFKKESFFKKQLMTFHDQLYFFRQHPKAFMRTLAYSFPIQLLTPLSFFVVSKAFGLQLPILYFFIVVPIVCAIALIPITIAGAGTREAATVYFFSLVGVAKSIGLGISLLNLVFIIILGILGGVLYVSVYHRWLQPHS